MVMTVAYPKKAVSLTEKVLERVYGNHSTSSSGNLSFDRDDNYEEDDESNVELMPIGAERTKNVLILMSDAGGGHRASADEAIRDAFKIEFGEEYRIFVKDVCKEYAGWPSNDMERSYKFMVKHVQLRKVAFRITSPKWIHSCYLAAMAAYYAKEVEVGLMEYKQNIIISVLPLMQHIPLRVLKWQGLQKKVIFVTVITELNTCHPTWFHPRVNRCYCSSKEVAKRASYFGLEESRIRVFGMVSLNGLLTQFPVHSKVVQTSHANRQILLQPLLRYHCHVQTNQWQTAQKRMPVTFWFFCISNFSFVCLFCSLFEIYLMANTCVITFFNTHYELNFNLVGVGPFSIFTYIYIHHCNHSQTHMICHLDCISFLFVPYKINACLASLLIYTYVIIIIL
ncbi:Monogalactosyldiacylglycerol synthase 2 [Citrus sinensis]|nr:Monogalactosyldiacylglycerol synthase 2 [Citrus sinensis]